MNTEQKRIQKAVLNELGLEKPMEWKPCPEKCQSGLVIIIDEEDWIQLKPKYRFMCNQCHEMIWQGHRLALKDCELHASAS